MNIDNGFTDYGFSNGSYFWTPEYFTSPYFTSPGSGGGSGGGWSDFLSNIKINIAPGASGGTGGASAPDPTSSAVQILNAIESRMQQNLNAYLAGDRTLSSQQTALGVFDQLWTQTQQLLSNPALGSWGRNGLVDRSRGGQYDWFAYYRDPIANDKTKVDVPGLVTKVTQPWTLFIVAGIVLAVLLWRRFA